MLLQIGHRLTIDLDHFQRTRLLDQILRHHTHTWPYLENRQFGKGFIHGVGNAPGDIKVSQEVLAEIFLGSYLFHGCKGTIK